MLRRMWIRAFDLDKAFGADRLLTTPGSVQVRGIIEETNRAFCCVLVQIDFNWLSVDEGIWGKLEFPWGHISLRIATR